MSEQDSKPTAGSSGTPGSSSKSPAKPSVGSDANANKKKTGTQSAPASGASTAAAPAKERAPARPRRSRSAVWLASLALLIALLAVAGAAYLWRQQQQLQADLQQRVADLQNSDATLGRDWQSRAGDLQQQDEQIRQAQQALEESVESVRELAGRSRRDWMLAEVEYLLRIANRRLQLQHDVITAIAALASADARLRELADPGLIEVRQQIARELNDLRGTPRPDLEGMALQLSTLSEQVAQLPVKAARAPERAPRDSQVSESDRLSLQEWRQALGRAWEALKSLVVIRRRDEPIAPLLGPEQEFAVREGMRMQLEAARLALLQQNANLYRTSIQGAQAWLQRYFVPEDSRTQAMHETLQQLGERDIDVALPDISTSLRSLRDIMKQRGVDTETAPSDELTAPPESAPAQDGAASGPDNQDTTAPAPEQEPQPSPQPEATQ